jgi:predicted nucleic acid-binding protein
MTVVSDTSPLNYLVQMGYLDILPALYGEIVIPRGVAHELTNAAAPAVARQVIKTLPSWLVLRDPESVDRTIGLGAGETEAISLALELKADRILIDDRAAYRAAVARGLNAAGTLTVLGDASDQGLLEIGAAIDKLRATNFRASQAVLDRLLEMRGKGKK